MFRRFIVCDECEYILEEERIGAPPIDYNKIVETGESQWITGGQSGWAIEYYQDPSDGLAVGVRHYCPDCNPK